MDSDINVGDFVMAIRNVKNPAVPTRTADVILGNIYSVRNIHKCKCGSVMLDIGLHDVNGTGNICLSPYHDNENWPDGFSIDRSKNRISFSEEKYNSLSDDDKNRLSSIIKSMMISSGKVVYAASHDFVKINLEEQLRERKINQVLS